MTPNDKSADDRDWLAAEIEDMLNEDYELEMSEPALSMELRRIYKEKHPQTLDRATYFKALLTLQAELIKLQDWGGGQRREGRCDLRGPRCRG
jgi:hypothetical protein